MTIKLEVGKRYRTRGDDTVEILLLNPYSEEYRFVGVSIKGFWAATWTEEGRMQVGEENVHDLIEEIRPKRVVWVNSYAKRDGSPYFEVFASKEDADSFSIITRIACQRVEIEEGRFDD